VSHTPPNLGDIMSAFMQFDRAGGFIGKHADDYVPIIEKMIREYADPAAELAALRAEVERLREDKKYLLNEFAYTATVCANAIACTTRGTDTHGWLCKAIKTFGLVFDRYGFKAKDVTHKAALTAWQSAQPVSAAQPVRREGEE
jgi:hypothetical protein